MSVAEALKSSTLPASQDTNNQISGSGVPFSSPAKLSSGYNQPTPLRARNQQFNNNNASSDKPSDGGNTSKGKNPPKPPDEFYKDLQSFHERRG